MLYQILNSKAAERFRRFWGLKTGVYLKLKRFSPSASYELRTATILKSQQIDFVIDIGANTGQFAESLFDFGYQGKVLSFEPVKSAYDVLQKRSSSVENWEVAERCAIGDQDGQVTIHVSNDTQFSSIKPMKNSYSKTNNEAKVIATEEIPLYQLDSIISKYCSLEEHRVLLKIDTQGFEKQVLEGAKNTLTKVVGLKIEIPLYPIYDQVDFTFYEILDFMKQHDFLPFSFNNEGINLKTGRVYEMDGLFIKQEKIYTNL